MLHSTVTVPRRLMSQQEAAAKTAKARARSYAAARERVQAENAALRGDLAKARAEIAQLVRENQALAGVTGR